MVFGRRVKPDWRQRVRAFLWPKGGLKRSARYIVKRVSRLNASPHAIAIGFAAGAAASFTPFIGFHFLIALGLAWLARGSLLASAFGTAIGNPLTFPLIFAATWETGQHILRLLGLNSQSASHTIDQGQAIIDRGFFSASFDALWPVLKPMCVGAVPLSLIAFGVFYVLMRTLVSAFQRTRRIRRAHKAAARLARKAPKPPTGLAADA